jgi:hypothetical protein
MRQVKTVLGLAPLLVNRRQVLKAGTLGALGLFLTGCAGGKWGFLSRQPEQPKVVIGPPPTAKALVDYLNDNARRVTAIECHELDLDCREGIRSVGLRGHMVCQKPSNFRMSASVVGHQEVDLGSNAQEFWFWIGKADPPYLYHCSYADFQRGNVPLPFPFQPEWIMEALGLGEYGAPEKYRVVERRDAYELVEDTVSPRGERLQKVTVFTKTRAQAPNPQVTAHILRDAKGNVICAAYVSEIQQDRATYAVIPRRVRLEWPQQKIEMKMKLDDLTVNGGINDQRAAVLFSRPQLQNVQSFDLARDAYLGDGRIRRAGASYAPAR